MSIERLLIIKGLVNDIDIFIGQLYPGGQNYIRHIYIRQEKIFHNCN